MASTNPFWTFATPLADGRPPLPPPLTFSQRLHNRLSQSGGGGDHVRVPSTEDIQIYPEPSPPDSAWSQASFQDVTFSYDASKGKSEKVSSLDDGPAPLPGNWPLTEQYYSLSTDANDFRCPRWTLWKTIALPTLAVILPMAFLVAGLLGLIFGYRVKSEISLFAQVSNSEALGDHAVVLVNYSATRIVFVASWASTLAPLLAGFIMNLASFPLALLMYRSSSGSDQRDLPTPYQYSLLIGLCLASMGRLRRYFSYSKEDGVVIPPVLRRAARTLSVALLLACIVFGADTALHYTTSTINFDQVSISPETHAYGRGLSQDCLSLNRSDNFGLPCSRNSLVAQIDYDAYVSSQNEIFYLQHDTSNTSEIRLVSAPAQPPDSTADEKVALLIPQSTNLSPYRDYRAETTGVITTCEPISSQCTWKALGPDLLYSQFNCSDNFYGVLGKAANTTAGGTVITDSDVPPLGFKPGAGLQYGFFTDSALDVPYDSAGNLGPFIPDADLINPVFFGIAARFASTSQRAGVNMSSDPGVHQGASSYVDFVLRCRYTTYNVDYTWVNGTARIGALTASPNGTIAEIFHGYNRAGTSSAFDNDLQDFLLQAALQPNAALLAASFAASYSQRIMSVIGPFLSSRTNSQEQTRTPLLVAKVPKAPLAILIACGLLYVVLGVGAALSAHRALCAVDVRDLAFRFSLPALSLTAFRDAATDRDAAGVINDDDAHGSSSSKRRGCSHRRVFDEARIRGETMRVAAEGSPGDGFALKSLV